jgi:autotransporter passenger strand-loop-strand repeat protein
MTFPTYTAAQIEAMTAADIAALGVPVVVVSDASVLLTVAQALAFESATIQLVPPTDCFVHVADVATAIEGMSPTQIAALSNFGITAIEVAGQTVSGLVVGSEQMIVEDGGAALSTTVTDGGFEIVLGSGSTVTGTVLGSGGYEILSAGGAASGTVVSGGGYEYVAAGGLAVSTTVASGGEDWVWGGTASGATVESGATQYLQGGFASDTTVASGGVQQVNDGTASDTTVVSGGVLGVVSGSVVSGAHLDAGGTIDFGDIPYDGSGTASFDTTTHLLTLTDASRSESVGLDPNQSFAGVSFTVAEDNQGDTEITANGPPCYLSGTRILTVHGEVAVEDLRVGDAVVLASGGTAPIAWLGHRAVSRSFGDPLRMLPIRIEAAALGERMPVRDLLVSPDHALLLGGVLIQAGALLNGTTIRRERDMPELYTYYHVELADHALILAEGVAAETFVDTIDRMAFDNWHEHHARWPAGREIDEMPLPRAKSARQVPPQVRAALAERAARRTPTAA